MQANQRWAKEEKLRLWDLYQAGSKAKNGKLQRGLFKALVLQFPMNSVRAIREQLKQLKESVGIIGHQGQYSLWSEGDNNLMRDVYHNRPEWKIGKHLRECFPGRTMSSLYAHAQELGLSRQELPLRPFTLQATEAAFMAGLILGDGHVSCKAPPSRPHIKTLGIGFTNTDKALVDWFKRIPRGHVRVEDMRGKPGPIPKKKICYKWFCTDKATMRQLVKYLRPYMIGKKQVKLEEMAEALGMEAQRVMA